MHITLTQNGLTHESCMLINSVAGMRERKQRCNRILIPNQYNLSSDPQFCSSSFFLQLPILLPHDSIKPLANTKLLQFVAHLHQLTNNREISSCKKQRNISIYSHTHWPRPFTLTILINRMHNSPVPSHLDLSY
uniref:Aoc1 n=1 Tax=Arundo donax TaxID=35708 RepID=A0A0A9ASV1_ARUDO